MTTLSKTYGRFDTDTQTITLASRYNRFIQRIEFSYFSLIAMFILIASCLGSVTTMQVFENNAPLWQFIVSLGFTMANLVACISQSPLKWVVGIFASSMVINTLILVVNVL